MSDQASVILYSDGLLSMRGFDDGDAPGAWMDYCDEHGTDCTPWHPVLIQLVRRFLLPVLEQEVTVVEISTIHNPIRAKTVGGVDVTNDWRNPRVALAPEFVEIPITEVARVALALQPVPPGPRHEQDPDGDQGSGQADAQHGGGPA
jgi:hypothetical protein